MPTRAAQRRAFRRWCVLAGAIPPRCREYLTVVAADHRRALADRRVALVSGSAVWTAGRQARHRDSVRCTVYRAAADCVALRPSAGTGWVTRPDSPPGWCPWSCGTWASDTGANFAGRTFKGPKHPPVSPGKTRTGAIGGVGDGHRRGGVLGAGPYGFAFSPRASCVRLGASAYRPSSVILPSRCSSAKRDSKTAAPVPGHGGVLDRFDSLFFALPVTAVLLLLIRRGLISGRWPSLWARREPSDRAHSR